MTAKPVAAAAAVAMVSADPRQCRIPPGLAAGGIRSRMRSRSVSIPARPRCARTSSSPAISCSHRRRLPDGRIVVVNRGYVPLDRKTAPPGGASRDHRISALAGDARLVRLRARDRRNLVRSRPARDGESSRLGHGRAVLYRSGGAGSRDGFPKPGPLAVQLRNDHLGYALTWFGLAASLVAVFVAWGFRERYNKTA